LYLSATMSAPVVAARSGVLIEGGKRLICSTMSTLKARLNPDSRLLGLDVTRTHLSISISDSTRQRASPYGVIRRSTVGPQRDAAILRSVISKHSGDDKVLFDAIHGVIIGAESSTLSTSAAYVRDLFSDPQLLPSLHSFLYYSEAACVVRATNSARDVLEATQVLSALKEKRKVPSKFDRAMYASLGECSEIPRAQRARISSSEILQAALDDLARLEIQEDEEERALET